MALKLKKNKSSKYNDSSKEEKSKSSASSSSGASGSSVSTATKSLGKSTSGGTSSSSASTGVKTIGSSGRGTQTGADTVPESKVTVPTVSAQRTTSAFPRRDTSTSETSDVGWKSMMDWLTGRSGNGSHTSGKIDEPAPEYKRSFGDYVRESPMASMLSGAFRGYESQLLGNATTTAQAMQNATDWEGRERAERERTEEQYNAVLQERNQYVEDSEKYGLPVDQAVLADYDQRLSALNPDNARTAEEMQTGAEAALNQTRETRERLEEQSAIRTNEAARRMERDMPFLSAETPEILKELGANTVADVLASTGVSTLQTFGDAALAPILPGGAMSAMRLRLFGGGAADAEREGKGLGEQIWEGAKQAIAGTITEKIVGGNPIYDKTSKESLSIAGWALQKALGRERYSQLIGSVAAQAMRVPLATLGEAIEEVAEDYINPALDTVRDLMLGEGLHFERPDAGTLAMDAIGGAVGALAGQGANFIGTSVFQRGADGESVTPQQAAEAAQTQAQTEGTDVLTTQEADVKRGMQEPVEDIVARAMVPEAAEVQAPVENTDPAVDVITQAALGEQAAQPEQAQAPMTLEETTGEERTARIEQIRQELIELGDREYELSAPSTVASQLVGESDQMTELRAAELQEVRSRIAELRVEMNSLLDADSSMVRSARNAAGAEAAANAVDAVNAEAEAETAQATLEDRRAELVRRRDEWSARRDALAQRMQSGEDVQAELDALMADYQAINADVAALTSDIEAAQNAQTTQEAPVQKQAGARTNNGEPFQTTAEYDAYVQSLPQSQIAEQHSHALEGEATPKTAPTGERVSRFYGHMVESEATPEWYRDVLKRNFQQLGTYTSESFADVRARAEETLRRFSSLQDAASYFTSAVADGQVSTELVAIGHILRQMAIDTQDEALQTELTAASRVLATTGARVTNAQKMWEQLSPYTQAMDENLTPQQEIDVVRQMVAMKNAEYVKNHEGKKAPPRIDVPEGLYEQYENAATDEERDRIIKQIKRTIARQAPSSLQDKLDLLRYTAMLFNPKTHLRNIGGNAANLVVRNLDYVVSSTLQSIFLDKAKRTRMLTTGLTAGERSVSDYAGKLYDDLIKWKTNGAASQSKYIGDIDALTGADKWVFKTPFFHYLLESPGKANQWALGGEDILFSKPAFNRVFMRECKLNGVETAADIENLPPAKLGDIISRSMQYAQESTFNQNSDISTFLTQTLRPGPNDKGAVRAVKTLGTAVMPFVRTNVNIMGEVLQHSPAGVLKNIASDLPKVMQGKISGAEFCNRIAKSTTGLAMLGIGMWLRSLGILTTGDGGDDDDETDYAKVAGWKPFALKIGDQYRQVTWASTLASPLFTGATLYDMLQENSDGSVTLHDMLTALSTATDPQIESTMMESVNDVLQNIDYLHDEGHNYVFAAAYAMALNLASQFFPSFAGSLERIGDRERQTTFVDRTGNSQNLSVFGHDVGLGDFLTGSSSMQYELGNALNRVPGIDYNQIPYIDAWGRREDRGNFGQRLWSSIGDIFNTTDGTEKGTPFDDDLREIYEATGANVFPEKPSQSIKVNNHYLTADEYVTYSETLGSERYAGLDDLVSMPAWKTMSYDEKAKAIGNVYTMARYAAAKAVDPAVESDDGIIKNADEIKRTYGWNDGEYAAAYATYGSSFLTNDTTKTMYDAGVPIDSWYSIDSGIASLPHAGSKVQDWQKLLAISESNLTGKQKETYYEGILTARSDTPWAEYKDVVAGGGTMLDFVSGHGYSSYEGHEDPSYYTVSSEQTTRPTSSRTKSKKDTIDSEPEDDTGWLARLFSGTLAG